MKRYMLLVFGVLAVLTGCTPTLPPATAGGGFSFLTTMLINGYYSLAPYITLEADFVSDFDYTAAGNPATIRGQTDVEALLAVPNGRAPANWRIYWINGGSPACPVAFHNGSTVAIGLHRVEQVTCSITNNALSMSDSVLTIAPGTIATLAAPSTVTVYGQGSSSQYGMPLMQYYDIYGTLVGQ